jgi:DnaJ-class molecular chaperone
MRCLTCAGKGWVRNDAATRTQLPAVPCPRCGGSGWDHCCEGSDASCEVLVTDPQPVAIEPLLFPARWPKPAA